MRLDWHMSFRGIRQERLPLLKFAIFFGAATAKS
jgi:hypothetical protein